MVAVGFVAMPLFPLVLVVALRHGALSQLADLRGDASWLVGLRRAAACRSMVQSPTPHHVVLAAVAARTLLHV